MGNNRWGWRALGWLREQGADVVGMAPHPPARRRPDDEILAAGDLPPERVLAHCGRGHAALDRPRHRLGRHHRLGTSPRGPEDTGRHSTGSSSAPPSCGPPELRAVADAVRTAETAVGSVRSIRPGNGLHTRHLDDVLGPEAARDVARGAPLSRDLVRMPRWR